MTNGFAFNYDKSLQIYFFCVKCQEKKNDCLKDAESSVALSCTDCKMSSLNFQCIYIVANIQIQPAESWMFTKIQVTLG